MGVKLGEALRAAREARELSQRDVAKVLRLQSRVTVHNWESGKSTPSPARLKELGTLYTVDTTGWERLDAALMPPLPEERHPDPRVDAVLDHYGLKSPAAGGAAPPAPRAMDAPALRSALYGVLSEVSARALDERQLREVEGWLRAVPLAAVPEGDAPALLREVGAVLVRHLREAPTLAV